MLDYRAMYYHLAACVSDAVDLLTVAKQLGEKTFLYDDPPPVPVSVVKDKDADE